VIIANWDTAAVVAGLIIGVQAIVFIIVCMITLFLLSIPCHWLILKIDDWSDLRQARKIAEADAAWQADFDRRHPPAP
jgi:hypothetical protein